MSVLLIDYNNLAIRSVFSDKNMINNPKPEWNLHKHQLLQSIFYNVRKFKPTEVILAIDDKNNWRKKVYPDYKAKRKDKKDNDIFPWDEFYTYLYSFTEEMKEVLPFYFMQVPYTEADDIVGVLSKHIIHEKIVVSGDSDYIQLLNIPNLKLFNPRIDKFVVDPNPKQTIMIKILSGDDGDNIPNLKSRLGEKTAEKLIINNQVEIFINENKLENEFKRNQLLIDWNFIPNIIQTKIIEQYNNYDYSIYKDNLFNFFLRHRLRQHTEDISIIKNVLKPIQDTMLNKDFMKFCKEN